jgi:hypothetical protein
MRTILTLCLLLAAVPLLATPSTLVWIPSTDIQPRGVLHLGVDSYVFTAGDDSPAPIVDFSLTYGITPKVEVGIDLFSNTGDPLFFNGKVQLLSPTEKLPLAVAAGIYNAGTAGATNQSLWYAVGSYTCNGTRLTAGGYTGRNEALGDDHSGLLLGLDKQLNKTIWLGVDYQSGDNPVGALNFGVGYTLSENVSVIVGYDIYNVGGPDSVNFQLDANF